MTPRVLDFAPAADPRSLDVALSTPAEAARQIGVLQLVLSLGTGGTERLVLEISKRLRSRFRIMVCTLDEPGVGARELGECGIDVVPLLRRSGFRPSLGRRIADLARQSRSSVIHCHHYSPFVYGRLAKLWSPGLKVVFTEHGRLSDGPPSRKRRLVNPLLARVPGPIFAVSGALRDSMIEEGYPADRIEVVHNGIDAGPRPSRADRRSICETLGLADSTLVIGTIARLDPVKDLGTLIEAYSEFVRTHPHTALVVVGDGEERARLEQTAARCGVTEQVRFLGERFDARRLLSAFDIYVNSSVSEGISLTILEAMAAEVPVVATRVGGTPEILRDGENGLLVAARHAAGLTGAIASLADAPARRRQLGIAGRRTVTEHFTLDRMVEQYAQLYLRLMR